MTDPQREILQRLDRLEALHRNRPTKSGAAIVLLVAFTLGIWASILVAWIGYALR